ncbi:hypothetical protein D3C72_1114540 [compost metagenome]
MVQPIKQSELQVAKNIFESCLLLNLFSDRNHIQKVPDHGLKTFFGPRHDWHTDNHFLLACIPIQ